MKKTAFSVLFVLLLISFALMFSCINETGPAIEDTYIISGMVTGADSVTVVLSGDASGSQTVNDGGSYSFTVGGGGNYTVTPVKTGSIFAPASQTFMNVMENVTRDFSVFQQTKRPVNLVGTFFKITDSIRLTWDMPDITSVTNYLVAWSDSSGKFGDDYTNSLDTTYTLQTAKVFDRMGYTTTPDTLFHVIYFTVSALYNNKDWKNVIGPGSAVDSVLVIWK